jgi:hypothetical protein
MKVGKDLDLHNPESIKEQLDFQAHHITFKDPHNTAMQILPSYFLCPLLGCHHSFDWAQCNSNVIATLSIQITFFLSLHPAKEVVAIAASHSLL